MLDKAVLDFHDNGIKVASYSTKTNILLIYVDRDCVTLSYIRSILPTDTRVYNLFNCKPNDLLSYAELIIRREKSFCIPPSE